MILFFSKTWSSLWADHALPWRELGWDVIMNEQSNLSRALVFGFSGTKKCGAKCFDAGKQEHSSFKTKTLITILLSSLIRTVLVFPDHAWYSCQGWMGSAVPWKNCVIPRHVQIRLLQIWLKRKVFLPPKTTLTISLKPGSWKNSSFWKFDFTGVTVQHLDTSYGYSVLLLFSGNLTFFTPNPGEMIQFDEHIFRWVETTNMFVSQLEIPKHLVSWRRKYSQLCSHHKRGYGASGDAA